MRKYIKRIDLIKEQRSNKFRFTDTSDFFYELYFPNIHISENKDIYISFQSPYNYDLNIELNFDVEGNFLEGDITHQVKDWTYDYKDFSKISGFEKNDLEFRLLKRISSRIIKNNTKGIKDGSIDRDKLEDIFRERLGD